MKIHRLHIVAAVAALVLLGPSIARADADVVPPDWLPALHQSIKNTLAQMKDSTSTEELNRLSRQVAEMRDAQLYIAYVRLYEKLGSKARAKLVTEQAEWLAARAKAAKKKSKSGSLAELEANNAEVTFTEARLNELRARYQKAGGED